MSADNAELLAAVKDAAKDLELTEWERWIFQAAFLKGVHWECSRTLALLANLKRKDNVIPIGERDGANAG